jgi:hypothetical protein
MNYFFFLLLLASNAFAQSMGVNGTAGISPWYQHNTGKTEEFDLKGRFRVNGWINITENGCVKVQARLTTGDKLNNEWINTGMGTNDPKMSVALRQLYVDVTCLKNVKVQVGSVPVENFGSMGLSDNGSIDGISVVINDVANKRDYIVALGNVDVEASLLNRSMDHINHASVQVRQHLGAEVDAYASMSYYEDTLFSRAGLSWAVSKYVAWLKTVGADSLFSDQHYIGVRAYTDIDLGKFKNRVSFTSINPNPSDSDRLAFTMKQFYGYGRNFYFETSRDLSPSLSVNLRVRVGDAGPMAQAGLTWKFNAQKKKKRPTDSF